MSKSNKYLVIATIAIFLIVMFAGSKARAFENEAQALEGWTVIAKPRPTATPKPVIYELEPDVIETIKFNFKDLGSDVVEEALLVAQCESGIRANAVNTKNKDESRDDGAFQINSIHSIPVSFLHNHRVNIAVARKLYDDSGWQPWYSSNSCHKLLK